MVIQTMIEHVFGSQFLEDIQSDYQAKHPDKIIDGDHEYTIQSVNFTINRLLNKINPKEVQQEGRIGPVETVFDFESKSNFISLSADKLTATCTIPRGAGSVKANTAVYKGKWQYEVQLGTCGIMQIGWCTVSCKFIAEIGVGDTTHSYAYDGQRNKKWNIVAQTYGETWFAGDIIGTTIDMNAGTIEFYRNGFSLGVAFDKIQTGPGMAYFPAISLSSKESVVANFGGSPFKYPLSGFEPIQLAPLKECMKANLVLYWLENLLSLISLKEANSEIPSRGKISEKALFSLFASLHFRLLFPFLKKTYVIEACLLPFLKEILFGKDANRTCVSIKYDVSNVELFLDYAWLFLEEDMSQVLLKVCQCLDSSYRTISYDVDYPQQRETLCVLHALIKHTRTRRHLINRVFFNTIMIHNFLHIKPLDDKILNKLVPVVCWEYETDKDESRCKGEDAKEKYAASIKTIEEAIADIEKMQINILRVLFTNTDGIGNFGSSRKMFLKELRVFLIQLSSMQSSMFRSKHHKILGPTLLSNFYQLISLLQLLWKEEILPEQPVLVPAITFRDVTTSFSLEDFPRLGGSFWRLASSTNNNHNNNNVTDTTTQNNTTRSRNNTRIRHISIQVVPGSHVLHPNAVTEEEATLIHIAPDPDPDEPFLRVRNILSEPGNMDSKQSLIELINNLVLMYNCGVHKHLVKVASIKTKMREYTTCYLEYNNKLSQKDDHVVTRLSKYFEVCRNNIDMQGRHVAWILSAIYSPEKRLQFDWLLRTVLRTLEEASLEKSRLFSFVPCFYVETMVSLTSIMRTHFDPLVPIQTLPNYLDLLQSVAQFLTCLIPDSRITNKGVKDTLRESAAGFFCCPLTLKCMESVSDQCMDKFIHALLRAYQGSNWAHTHWILVRIWYGSGFAFRYTHSPHLSNFSPDLILGESNLFCPLNTPNPSAIYQENIKKTLLRERNAEPASAFLNSLLNKLNWAFSEFITMIQHLQNISKDRVVLQTRHLMITATCFEILVGLLRVMEMVVVLARPLFTDSLRPNSASMLERLCQILGQLLLRCSSSDGCFNFIINLVTNVPEILAIDHFPILSAIAGILVSLLGDEINPTPESTSIPPVTRQLLSENFPLHSVKFMLNEIDNTGETTSGKMRKPFTFESYPSEVTREELDSIRRVIASLEEHQKRLSTSSELDDDNKCAICYNYQNSVKFEPCGHESCQSCINHHLLNTRQCFFCKTIILKVIDIQSGQVLNDFTEEGTTRVLPIARDVAEILEERAVDDELDMTLD
ncbi:hypothetical protein WDU94_002990 [Cyamophila willieti]